jgi:peptidoglycan hydrolase-like protein with peptidoglycan-binding domain
MSLLPARLFFLAFVGLVGGIIYNALYLQDLHSATDPAVLALPEPGSQLSPLTGNGEGTEPPAVPAVSTDLTPAPGQQVPEQLVKAVQRELSQRGYDAGTADGLMRDQTRNAISSFEKDHGLTVTGMPSDELLRQILLGDTVKAAAATGAVTPQRVDATPRKGDSTVRAVQQILADLGYAPGPVDGAMGSSTESAISAFQRDRKIAATGRISPEFLREIKRVTGRNLAEAGPRR